MKTSWIKRAATILFTVPLGMSAATLHVDLNSANPIAPYASWITAATNIQDAIEAAVAGDLVLVTNGVYAAGGKVMAGDLTNRVAIDKAITVQSVNGWAVTIIAGEKDVATNGPAAVRCAWLTNGAALNGFTLRDGATRAVGDQFSLRSGGGIWATSTNAIISGCLVADNDAHYGAGTFRGWMENCTITRNVAQADGGGGYSNMFYRCVVMENVARINGGGTFSGWARNSVFNFNTAAAGGGVYGAGSLVNCTVAFNKGNSIGGTYSIGAGWFVTNCIIWGNQPQNNSSGLFRNTCTTPLPGGTGNISSDPLLLLDGIHIASNSPCRTAGFVIATGADLDGQSWNSPPAMGCDEWKPEPIVSTPRFAFDSWNKARVSAFGIGLGPFTYQWVRNGVLLGDGGNISGATNAELRMDSLGATDVGSYQVIASNSLGTVTSQVAQLTIRFVALDAVASTFPFTNWTSAATNLQDAVGAARTGDLILVADGVYGQGGKVKAGDLTNRVALDKAVTLMSVNGPAATIIQGAWDRATTNGPGAVRGVWIGEGARLVGVTVRGGATRGTGGDNAGGGIWCSSTNATIVACLIQGNAAGAGGGGGVWRGFCHNSLIKGNVTTGYGAGALFSVLFNCTVGENVSYNNFNSGSGVASNLVYNSIVWGNYRVPPSSGGEYIGTTFTNSCTRPLPAGAGNISTDPLFEADGFHLQAASPCLNAGSSNYLMGLDLDGQTWSTLPAMGCDERSPQLAVASPAIVLRGDGKVRLRVAPVGAVPMTFGWFKDGNPLGNDAHRSGVQTAELVISEFGPSDAGSYRARVTNDFEIVESAALVVQPRFVAVSNLTPAVPYTNWTAAATSIQAAVDAASHGDLIVVADGVYASGGGVISGGLTNRVALSKTVRLTSLNGPTNTIIEGQKDIGGPNGNGNNAVRAVWMDNWTSLAGFTIRNGATRISGDVATLQSGGGLWALGGNSLVQGCVITNNSANQNGGGSFGGSFERCIFVGNNATNGGGLYGGAGNYCFFTENRSLTLALSAGGGGANGATLRNCVIHKNRAYGGSAISAKNGGTGGCNLFNCSVTENEGNGIFFGFIYNTVSWGNTVRDYAGSVSMHFSCANFAIGNYGTNNLFTDPQLVDPFHLSINSPCRSAGGPLFITGTDWDGDAWGNPASIGADEYVINSITGPLMVSLELPVGPVYPNRTVPLIGRISGRASRVEWTFDAGNALTNLSYATSRSWSAPGSYPVIFRALNESFPAGVSATAIVEVVTVPAPNWASIENLGYQRFYINTAVGVTNYIEFTTNLAPPVVWLPLKTSVATNALMREFDFESTNAARFYRIRSE